MRQHLSGALAVASLVLVLQAPVLAGPADSVVADGSAYAWSGADIERTADSMVTYTPAAGQTVSPANEWGAEVALRDGRAVEVRDRQTTGEAGTPIPSEGVVISGHGRARQWLLLHVRVGTSVTVPGVPAATPSASTAPVPAPSSSPTRPPATPVGTRAVSGSASYPVLGTDVPRAADALVVYTQASGTISPANQWGAEAALVDGTVTAARDRQTSGATGLPIPLGGAVLSGHGAARSWLLTFAKVGATVAVQATSASCAGGLVRLTFDDGPDAVVTPKVLDVLRDRGARATFFVIGNKAAAQPALVARTAREGHRVGNHTWDHPSLTTLTATAQRSQFERTTTAITAAGAPRPSLWRPPYEDWNSAVRDLASNLGLEMMLWTYPTDSNDWQGGTPADITNRVLAGARDGSIVLMHDRVANSAAALPSLLDGLAAKRMCVVL